MAFDLQNLPFRAFKEVLSTIDLREKFLIATLSKKSASLVKKSLSLKKYKLTLSHSKHWDLEEDRSDYSPQIKKGERHSSKEGGSLDLLKTLEFIIDVFNKPRTCLLTNDPLESYYSYFPFFERLELKVNTLHFQCQWHELQSLLEDCEKIPNIQVMIYSSVPSEIVDFNKQAKYHFEEAHFIYGDDKEWVSHNDLLISSLDCKRVQIGFPFFAGQLASQELQERSLLGLVELLKRWIAGSRMEFLNIWKIPMNFSKFKTVFKSLGQRVPVKQATYPKKGGGWKTINFHDNCYMIEQNKTGRKAHVFVIHDEKNYYTLLLRMAPETFVLA
uniref:F-box domain-containing protein n=1 Tax=Caenorhabditis tropicalis TaxID=1561998 RepID=A0A1I7USW8_9PELO